MNLLKLSLVIAALVAGVAWAQFSPDWVPGCLFTPAWALFFLLWLPFYFSARKKEDWQKKKSPFHAAVQTQALLSVSFLVLAVLSSGVVLAICFLNADLAKFFLLSLITCADIYTFSTTILLVFSVIAGLVLKERRLLYLQASTLFAVALISVAAQSARWADARESRLRVKCAEQLKSLGNWLEQYSEGNNGFFPEENNDAGLRRIVLTNLLGDSHFLRCPSVEKRMGKNFDLRPFSYVYVGGLRKTDHVTRRPCAWDKPGNHKDYGNVLYTDGGVESFEGPDWMKKAGVDK